MDDKEKYACKKCNRDLSGIRYSSGGIGVTDSYFSWSLRRDLDNPDSDSYKIMKSANIQQRLIDIK